MFWLKNKKFDFLTSVLRFSIFSENGSYVISQLLVHPLLRKILDPPLQCYFNKESHRPIRLTQCCTQFKSPGDKILCVLYLHYNVAFTFK